MKELWAMAQDSYYHDLKHAYVKAVQANSDTVFFNGREISKAYAEYLLHFEHTFLKDLRDDYTGDTNNESERLV